jgi:hypothetical protein
VNDELTSRDQQTFDDGGLVPPDTAGENRSRLLNGDAKLIMVVKLPFSRVEEPLTRGITQ